jgi:hypothetical protein
MLENEFKYYLENQTELVKKYDKKFIVIMNENVVGVYDKKEDAYFESKEKYGLGSFLIQYCAPGTMFYTQNFYTQNVAF